MCETQRDQEPDTSQVRAQGCKGIHVGLIKDIKLVSGVFTHHDQMLS